MKKIIELLQSLMLILSIISLTTIDGDVPIISYLSITIALCLGFIIYTYEKK